MTATTVRQHQPWCRDHYIEDDDPEDCGWCQANVLIERYPATDSGRRPYRLAVIVEPRALDEADAAIEVYVSEHKLDPDEARRVAAALLEAADLLEASR